MAKKPRPKPEKTLEELAAEKYGKDNDLARRVIEHAKECGTVEMIEDGRSVLPHPQDARRHFAAADAAAKASQEEAE